MSLTLTWLSFAKTPRQPNFIHVTCVTRPLLYVVDFKCAPNFDETQEVYSRPPPAAGALWIY
jgi:hypothetical protein